MAIRNVLGVLSAVGFLAGCGGAEYSAKAYTPSASYGGGGGVVSPQSVSADYAPTQPSPMSAQRSGGSGGRSYEAQNTTPTQPTERPGLGTGWGESRTSHVHEVAFEREGATPFAMGALHYNDRHGVEALASYHQAVTGGFFHDVPEAGGAITVAIVGDNGMPLDALCTAVRSGASAGTNCGIA